MTEATNAFRVANRWGSLQPSSMLKIFNAAAKIEDLSNLSIGEPDFDTDADIVDAAAEAGRAGFTHYPPLPGYADLRAEICSWWKRRHGLDATPDEVFVTVGGIQASSLFFEAMLDPGDEALVVEPYFTAYAQQIEYAAGAVVPVPTRAEDGFQPAPDAIERAVTAKTRVLVLNTPNNPTGAVLSRECLEGVAAVAKRRNLFVLSDEIYESFVFRGVHASVATLPGMKERTITLGGFSKSHCMTGWRIGYVIGRPDLLRTMITLSVVRTFGVNALAQRAALYALKTQDDRVRERTAVFGERMKYAASRLNAMKGVRCDEPNGSFYLFPDITGTGKTSEEFAWRLLEAAHVAVVPGTSFGKSGEGHVRIACTLPMEGLAKAFDRMERALPSL